MTTASMCAPSNKRRFDNDEGPSSTLPLAPLRRRLGNEVGVEVPSVAEVEVPPLVAENVVSVPQDNNGSDGKGNDDMAVMTVAATMVRTVAMTMAKTKTCASLLG
jgi:hypothetical protein